MRRMRLGVVVGAAAIVGACAPKDLFVEGAAVKVAEKIAAKVGGEVKAMRVEIERHKLSIRAQDSGDKTKVKHWEYREGALAEPRPVVLLGKGKLDEHLFPLSSVAFAAVPAMVREAGEKLGKPITSMFLSIGMFRRTANDPPTWMLLPEGGTKDGWVGADLSGKITSVNKK